MSQKNAFYEYAIQILSKIAVSGPNCCKWGPIGPAESENDMWSQI